MKTKYLTRVGVVAGVFVAATALSGLPWADASPRAVVADAGGSASEKPVATCVRFDNGEGPVCGIMLRGPRGAKGARGPIGKTGPVGLMGPQGIQGPQGVQGPQGIQGNQGAVGPTGPQGIQGAPGHTVVVAGTVVKETAPPQGEQNTELTPSVAQCPSSGSPNSTPEAYGGGVQIQKSGSESGGDVVTIEQHYLGTYVNSTTVNALPPGTNPGDISNQAANAYLGQAVITELGGSGKNNVPGDTVTVQSFVVCGP
jgi:Collagen triple helix repeat (20 copies)